VLQRADKNDCTNHELSNPKALHVLHVTIRKYASKLTFREFSRKEFRAQLPGAPRMAVTKRARRVLVLWHAASAAFMLVGQTGGLVNYAWTVSAGLQNPSSEVGTLGVEVNRSFEFGDTIVYVPLLLLALAGLVRRSPWAVSAVAASFAISAYWSSCYAFLFVWGPGHDRWVYEPSFEVWLFVAFYFVSGLVGLAWVFLVAHGEESQKNGHSGDDLVLRLALWAGPAASVAFLAADVAGSHLATRESGYSKVSDTISELLIPSVGPEKLMSCTVATATMIVADFLALAFGAGVVASARHNRKVSTMPLRRVGVAHIIGALANLASASAFPQDVRGAPVTIAGQLHLALVGIAVVTGLVSMLSSLQVRSEGFGRRFRVVTVATLFVMVAGGVFAPFAESYGRKGVLGVAERVSAFAFQGWQVALATLLLRTAHFPVARKTE
jgi:Protein of unknown function (DUF998)